MSLLAIWYNKISYKTLVWYTNGNNPAPKGSKLQLTADRGFTLSNPQGYQLWNSEIRNGVVDNGVMDDNATAVSASSGACGFNSICPSGYTLVDPMNQYGNYKPNFTQSCDQEPAPGEDLYEFEVLINVDWPLTDYALLEPFIEDRSRQSCLNDCMCAVAIFRAGDKCWKKKLPLSNGRVDPTLNGGKALIKVRKGNRPHFAPYFPNQELKNKDKNQEPLILALSILLRVSVFFVIILVTATCLGFYFINRKKLEPLPRNEPVVETNLRSFSYKELVDATNEFREELGRGAFGIVYKGALPMSYICQVAVKRLNTLIHGHAEKEFKTEVTVIGQTHYKNLVRLLGFCDEGENSTQIIHCDIKAQNFLLDEYYNARISDFGLAKLLLLKQSQTNTAIRGTKGYVAPEWFRNLPITVKVDVYSFGVLLLELTCCRNIVDMESGNEERAILTDWAYDCYLEGTLDALVENDVDASNDMLIMLNPRQS
ncbi:hypothetical protein F3Y22_tig00000715pilonHSYRG00077 [Hibiscus syriacus]|uniref:non-specific serine/threonine protein kinase n=1 Tax=Hibiscus syriacus TaxID=106335 RepID=A0A6A3D294_HIBSY|nr:hypothetical protein F3Y22_tig00000715pilonHSYRG00077 [Hibiscus syriacus]